MAILTYSISSDLERILNNIEQLKKQILLTPISPRSELRLKWEATLEKIFWSLSFGDRSLKKSQIVKILTKANIKKTKTQEKEVVNYKQALDYISSEWLIVNKNITSQTIINLYDLACKPTMGPDLKSFKKTKKNLDYFLEYIQTGSINPIIQAGIANIQLMAISPFKQGSGRVSRLLNYLILYKNAYDFRGFVVIDEYFRKDLTSLKIAMENVPKTKTLSRWLEYFATGVETQLNQALKIVTETKYSTDLPFSFWRLNDRQRSILNYLDQPGVNISNKKVQQMFKISQITASRDLAKLVSLNLLFSHGKGRSVYYTKV
ncbi:hypothetical protein A2Z22_02655 [Candidatus Woesebacteria bacterium RBG_16_34_12]|uniref:Fido domain-containing protein n=1 Tax=Candidatus Woesebacteria bacterium RBG_16_34_12 TaxID=1802480 RepID=A0A1F7X6Q6_9BACT|nr:MAG: hypothetical protein A2Z22_02655 [Candidatus Woesebacteria bacterium RBG_16_34_12]